jgi:low temperature requirement protein LtrA
MLKMPYFAPLRLRRTGEPRPRHATWFELFFDLVFVAVIIQMSHGLADDYSWTGALRFALLFLPIWWAWVGHTFYSTRFDSDDVAHRGLGFAQMVIIVVMGVVAADAFDETGAWFAGAAAAYRGLLAVENWRARQIPVAKALATFWMRSWLISAALWLAAVFVEDEARYALCALALLVEMAVPFFGTRHTRALPPHAEHLPERFGLFTIIVLGKVFIASLDGLTHGHHFEPAALIPAVLGMLTCFLFWWGYFVGVAAADELRIEGRRGVMGFRIWAYSHAPLYLGLIPFAIGIKHAVELEVGSPFHGVEAWILCGATALCMATLTSIGTDWDLIRCGWRARLRTGGHWLLSGAVLVPAGLGQQISATETLGVIAGISIVQVGLDRLRTPRTTNPAP